MSRIAEIEARLKAVTRFGIGMGDDWPILYKERHDIQPKTKEVDLTKADMYFLANAPSDIGYLLSLVKRYREALEFYSERKHMKMNEDLSNTSINYDYSKMDWKIGPPYVVGVEFGQIARQALSETQPSEAENGKN